MASGSSASGTSDIVVWEWEEDNRQWIPYDPATSNKMEYEYRNDPNQNFVVLVQTYSKQNIPYTIDFRARTQTNQYSGNPRYIRRTEYKATTAFAQGCYWEWCKQSRRGSKHWTPYSVGASNEIESHHGRGDRTFIFPDKFCMEHEIDLKKKVQINLRSGYKREIRRKQHKEKYSKNDGRMTRLPNGSSQSSGAMYPHFAPQPVGYGQSSSPHSFHGSSPTSSPPVGYGQFSSPYSPYGSSPMSNPPVSYGQPSIPHLFHGSNPMSSPPVSYGQSSSPHSFFGSNPMSSPVSPSNPSSSNLTWNVPANQGATGVGNSHFGATMHTNVNPPIISSYNPTNTSLHTPSSPHTSSSSSSNPPQSPTTGSGSVKKKKKIKSSQPVVVPPCPRGGIPCDASASTGTVPVSQVLQKFAKKVDVDSNSTDTCAICQSNLTEDSGFGSSKETMELSLCQHIFHLECLEASYSHGVQNGCIICPSCTKTHGIKTGNQPDGTMRYSQTPNPLPGYSGCGTIRVEYHIHPGVQTANHPHPGTRFSTPGFPRIGYLPDNEDGRRVLLLLVEAWKRRLIFTVGQSNTSGMQDCVTWTSIHHKTELYTNRGHGYPDDTYLDRVTAELEAEGVTEDVL